MIAYIREMPIKTTMRYYLGVVRMAIIKNLQVTNTEEGAENREPSCTVGENVSGCSRYGKQYGFLKKLKIELPHDSAIPLLGMYPDKALIQKDTCAPMLTAALFTTRNDLNVQSTDERMERLRFIFTMELCVTKKSETMPFAATPLQLEIIIKVKRSRRTNTV